MLVLSRKAGERVQIGSEIEVTVLGVHGGRVKLGFRGSARGSDPSRGTCATVWARTGKPRF